MMATERLSSFALRINALSVLTTSGLAELYGGEPLSIQAVRCQTGPDRPLRAG
jgi:hypothetical protein